MTKAINLGSKSGGSFDPKGTYEDLIAGNLVSLNDRVTVAGKFVIRTAAGDESIESGKDALLLEVIGGCGETEGQAFKINALRWIGANAFNSNDELSDHYVDPDTHEVLGFAESTSIQYIHTPKCEAGAWGTAEKNNGWLITDSKGRNRHVGDGVIVGVWHCTERPENGTVVTEVEEHTFAGHDEVFYLPEEGWLLIEFDYEKMEEEGIGDKLCVHLAWSKDYDKYKEPLWPADDPNELVIAVSALTSKFDTETINGKTCLILRGIEQGNGGIFDRVTIYPEGGGTYERNIAARLLTDLTWTETEIEGEDVEGKGEAISGYRYTASLPTSGTYAALFDGLIRSDVDGMSLDGFTLTYDSSEQIAPATAWEGKYVDYQIATPLTGTHTIDPTGKPADDMGTEEVVGGDSSTGTIVISYMRGFKDTMRALVTAFKDLKEQFGESEYAKPLYCVGAWLNNAYSASPVDQDNPDALAIFGNKDWALDWRPFLVDMTAIEGETKKHPVMELKKNNWLRDIYGNWAPVVGITTEMRDECMSNALYTDATCETQYCASGAYDPEAFLALCSIETVDGVKRLSHPTLYKAANTEVVHYLMPWETTETKYSIFVGRKDEVYLLDGVVGASGKEWNGILCSNINFWDGVDVKVYSLKPTGICPSPATAIRENGTNKIRCFFYNYPSTLTGIRGWKGYAPACEMFYDNGHYPTSGYSQITTKTNARANNYVATAPFPVAEGGFHARNTFLRCVETALGTKYLCHSERFSSGVSSNDTCNSEATFFTNGGVRLKSSGDSEWTYKKWSASGSIYYKDGTTYKTTNMTAMLSSNGPHAKTLEAQIAVSFAVEFGIGVDERFMFNNCVWWYQNPTTSTFTPPTLTDGYMNARVYKIVTGSFAAYSDAEGTEETFTVECCLRTGLMLGCDMSGDIGPYWGGGCEMVGDCLTAPSSNRYGHTIRMYIEPNQEKWVNDDTISIDMGQRFVFESRYKFAGSVVNRSNSYIRRRLPNTPFPVSSCGSIGKGECGYGYTQNSWGTVGKRTRVGVRLGFNASYTYLSARYLHASSSAGYTIAHYCGSAQVLLDVQ